MEIIGRIRNCKISALKFQSVFYLYFFKRLLNDFKYTEMEACIGRHVLGGMYWEACIGGHVYGA
jgi:hypothetical protein